MGILSWFARTRFPEEPGWLRRWVIIPHGRDDAKLAEIKRAAAADVEEMEEEDREYFRQDGPGNRGDGT